MIIKINNDSNAIKYLNKTLYKEIYLCYNHYVIENILRNKIKFYSFKNLENDEKYPYKSKIFN